MSESAFYCVRCRYGKIEIEVESSDREYVDRKLEELLRTFPANAKKKHHHHHADAKTAATPLQAKPAAPPKASVEPAPKAPAPAKAPGPAQVEKAAPAAKKAAPAVAPAPEVAKEPSNGINAEAFAQQIRGHARFAQIKKHILKQPSQLPRVLLCHYIADKLGPAQGLTANQVEAITGELGVRIAAPNVAKVIRQQAKKLFVSERQGGITRHRINRAGVATVERMLSGK